MRFVPGPEHRAFAASLHAMLTASDTPSAVRDWSRGDHSAGRALWGRLAEAGVFALAVPEEHGGLGARPVELAVAFVELGRHAVPGPLVETVAAAALLTGPGCAKRLLPALASGASMATVAYGGRWALDGDVAAVRLILTRHALRLAPGHGPPRPSLDPARRLTPLTPGGELLSTAPPLGQALVLARVTTAAQALGVGLALLDRTVEHVKRRAQFGVRIGSFQAVKHRLADVMIALEFARPLVRRHADAAPGGRGRRQGERLRGGVPGGPCRAATARRARLHRGVRPVPVADQGPRPAHGLGRPRHLPFRRPGRTQPRPTTWAAPRHPTIPRARAAASHCGNSPTNRSYSSASDTFRGSRPAWKNPALSTTRLPGTGSSSSLRR